MSSNDILPATSARECNKIMWEWLLRSFPCIWWKPTVMCQRDPKRLPSSVSFSNGCWSEKHNNTLAFNLFGATGFHPCPCHILHTGMLQARWLSAGPPWRSWENYPKKSKWIPSIWTRQIKCYDTTKGRMLDRIDIYIRMYIYIRIYVCINICMIYWFNR